MDNTPNLQLPYLIAAQAQKHVTHNEALRTLDCVVQLLVLDKDLASPPGSPTDGSRYIVAASPTGAWSGQAAKVAAWQDAAWVFYTAREGWLAWVADEDKIYVFDGSAWGQLVTGSGTLHDVVDDTTPQLGGDLDANGHSVGFDNGTGITDDSGNEQLLFHKTASAVNQVGVTNAATGNAPQLAAEGGDTNIDLKLRGKGSGQIDVDKIGINATADTTNRLAVKSPASLFDNVGGGHQQKVNKAAAGDTASTLYQTGYSGRAEYGLTGDDNFHVKVSSNGSTWHEAILVDRSNGNVGIGGVAPGSSRLAVADAADPNNLFLVKRTGGDWTFGGYYATDPRLEFSTNAYGSYGASYAANNGDGGLRLGQPFMFSYVVGGTNLLLNPVSGNVAVGGLAASNKLSVEGIAAPETDNAYTLGTGAKRWSQVYAATGTINTSDARQKTEVADSALGLAFVLALQPRAFKWIAGGINVEWDEETYQALEPVTEAKTVTETVVEVADGVAVQRQVERVVEVPVVDLVPVVDEAGAPVLLPDGQPKLHSVPRMAPVRKTRRVKREVARAGTRTHYGLIAQEVREALDAAGVGDFAGWVLADKNDPSSTQGLRMDQFIAPLIKAVQELSSRVVALEAASS